MDTKKALLHIPSSAAARMVGVCADTLKNRAKANPEHPQPVRATRTLLVWNVEELRAFYSLENKEA